MTPALLELLTRYRRQLADMREQLRGFEAGGLKIYTNGRDSSAEWADQLRSRIEDMEKVLARHDPDGLSA